MKNGKVRGSSAPALCGAHNPEQNIMTDNEKIILLQKYILDCDNSLRYQLKEKQFKYDVTNFDNLIELIRLQAKYEALNELQRNISKILYMR